MANHKNFAVFVVLVLVGISPCYSAGGAEGYSGGGSGGYSGGGSSYKWANIVYHGEETPVLAGTIWEYRDSDGGTARIEFLSGGRMLFDDTDATWERTDATVRYVVYGGYAYSEGAYNPETKRITGNGQNSRGDEWTFSLNLLPGSPPPGNFASGSAPTGIEGALEKAAEQTLKNVPQKARIAIVYITAQDQSTTDFISGELEFIWVNNGFIITDRAQLDRIRREQNFQLSGEIDDDTAVSIGKFIGADIIVTGRIDGEGNLRRLRLRALDTQTAQVVGVASERI
ncbi:MAG: penicillin-binding protein activator LpoB [Treponema sp.]|nr:penicillin-binding protein activator LpoB [Treponema sp.]